MNIRILLILFFFEYCKITGNQDLIGEYCTVTKESCIKITEISKNLINGKHCFVSINGERIDCYLDNMSSIKLKQKNKKEYEGVLISSYKEIVYFVKIVFDEEFIKLTFLEESHPFIAKDIILFKQKE